MSHLLLDSEPRGARRWAVHLQGECTAGCGARLTDEARALLLVGASEVDLDLSRLAYLDVGGASALAGMVASIDALGVPVTVHGAVGQPALLLEALAAR